jgi:hypothetical protein
MCLAAALFARLGLVAAVSRLLPAGLLLRVRAH